MSGLEYTEGGSKFRLVIDRFDGAVGNEGTSAPESVAQYFNLPNDVMLELENALVDIDGVARRRGTTKASAVGAYNANAATSGGTLTAFQGRGYLTSSVGPYFSTDFTASTRPTGRVQASAAAPVTTMGTLSLPVSRLPTVGGVLITAGTTNGGSNTPVGTPNEIFMIGGIDLATYSTGTVTISSGSAVVTGAGTAWTSAMQGSFINFTPDSTGYAKDYLVRSIDTSSQIIILAEPYKGDSPGSSKNYFLDSVRRLKTGSRSAGAWGTNDSWPHARVACEYANRLFLGWTKEPAAVGVSTAAAESPEYRSRLRWSGIIGSQEGYDSSAALSSSNNTAFTGMHAWHANGFLDLNTRFGGIQAMRSFNGTLTVWQEKGMTIVHGTPTYSGLGSIDASTTYTDIEINGGFAYEETEHGIFFIDKKRGPMIYTGSGKPEALPMSRFIKNEVRAYDHVGYVNDHVLFLNSGIGASTFRAWMYHVPTGRWSLWTNSSSFTITHPQRSNDHECVALLENGSGSRVISLDSLTRPDGTVSDVDGSTIQFSVQSKHFGDPGVNLRAEMITATLRYTGTTPLIFGNIYNSTPLGGTPKIVPLVGVADSSPGDSRAKTWSKTVEMDSGPAIRVEILESSSAGHLEVARIVVEGTVEGEIATT